MSDDSEGVFVDGSGIEHPFSGCECGFCADIEFDCCLCNPCFPSSSKVQLEDGNSVSMSDLKVGDKVLSGTTIVFFLTSQSAHFYLCHSAIVIGRSGCWQWIERYPFFIHFWRTHVLFGATGTPGLDFWWHLFWVSKPESVLPYSLFLRRRM